jgi:hypothetical protein
MNLTIYHKFQHIIYQFRPCPDDYISDLSNSEYVKISISYFYICGTTAFCLTLPNCVGSEDY